MSYLKKPINYKILENELDSALKADELYKLRNDAKIRAVEQRVPTYDNFRDMVLAAHLRPLERSDMQKKSEVSWNHCYKESKCQSNGDQTAEGDRKSNDGVDDILKSLPVDGKIKLLTTTEFLRVWSKLPDSSLKFEYLLHFRDCLKEKFFNVEVPSQFLGEFFKLGSEFCTEDTVTDIIDILEIFSQCNRFSLSVAMISSKEKQLLQLLFKKIPSFLTQTQEVDKVKKLSKKYCIL